MLNSRSLQFALIANCFFAPLMLHEHFHRKDILGILLAVFGAATVVASAQVSSPHLNPEQLLQALQDPVFIAYACVLMVLVLLLSYASGRKWGEKWVAVDVGLCALYGGFTVLSTKAISSLLTLEWFDIFAEWITYPLFVVSRDVPNCLEKALSIPPRFFLALVLVK
jgi:magnesium transporter